MSPQKDHRQMAGTISLEQSSYTAASFGYVSIQQIFLTIYMVK